MTRAPAPFGVVLMQNPKYDEQAAEAARAGGKMYTVPKRKFVRWADAPAAAPPAADGRPDGAAMSPADLAAEYRFCTSAEDVARLEAVRERLWRAADQDQKLVMKGAAEEARKRLGLPAAAGGKG